MDTVADTAADTGTPIQDPYVWKATDATPDAVRKADAAKPLTRLTDAIPMSNGFLGDVLVAGLVGAAIAVTLAYVNQPRRRRWA
ncbi:hypothetical protein [Asticcacaulis solisilvae]|uniref:hypothetical protein n=1 Tax=Asticcacaulis solisilvae TaxID=1217274 RepID=UPI003FD8D60A